MEPAIIAKSLLLWLGILVLAVANGVLREAVLVPGLGQVPALIISGILLSLLIVCVAYFALPWLAVRREGHLVAIGVGWLILTLISEFSFGLLRGESLSMLLEAYTFKGGNIWPLVLLVVTCAPYLAAKLRGWV
ncbi:MAG TPA: hypothetical protein VF268_14735 [Gammaproteobacteria bacterium]|jgi:hypothetical protein